VILYTFYQEGIDPIRLVSWNGYIAMETETGRCKKFASGGHIALQALIDGSLGYDIQDRNGVFYSTGYTPETVC
jgi:hypothetical protein